MQVIFFSFFASAEPSKYNCLNLDASFLPRGDNSKRQTLKVQQQAVSGVFEGREIKTEVFVEQRCVVFFLPPQWLLSAFLVKESAKTGGRERQRKAKRRVTESAEKCNSNQKRGECSLRVCSSVHIRSV